MDVQAYLSSQQLHNASSKQMISMLDPQKTGKVTTLYQVKISPQSLLLVDKSANKHPSIPMNMSDTMHTSVSRGSAVDQSTNKEENKLKKRRSQI